MGDILHALPAIAALRRAHPAWRIDWAVEPQWLPLLSAENENAEPDAARTAARPVVDRIHLIPSKRWGRKPGSAETFDGVRTLRHSLRELHYDAILDLQGSIKSSIVARLTGCRRIIGDSHPREAPARWIFTERVKTQGEHVIEQALELAMAVAGDTLAFGSPPLPVDLDAEDWCDRQQELKSALWMGKPAVLIHPGGGWGAKRWPAERYGAVAEEFAVRGGVVLVNSGPGEEALADAVVAGAKGQATLVQCSLPELIALTRRVSLVIGGDTGPVHLACALDKPVVGIYGPTDPKRNGPYGSRFRVLRNPESRQDHTRREATEAGLLTISPEMVLSSVVDLMVEERRAKRAHAEDRSERWEWDSRLDPKDEDARIATLEVIPERANAWPDSQLDSQADTGSGPIWEAKRS